MGNSTTCHVKDFTKEEVHKQYPCGPNDLTEAQQSQIMAQKVCTSEDLTDAQITQIQDQKTCTVSDLSAGDQLKMNAGDTKVVVTPNAMWKLDPTDKIYKCKTIQEDGVCSEWTTVGGLLKHIYVDAENNLWGVNSNHNVYKCEKKVDECAGGTEWKSPNPGSFASLYITDDAVWAINENKQRYKCDNPCTGKFVLQADNLPPLSAFAEY